MVQVLPQVPGFLERLGPVLQQAGQGIQQGAEKRSERLKSNALLGVINDPNASPLQKVNAFAQLPEAYKKSSAPVYASVLGPQAQAEADLNAFQNFASQNPSFNTQFRGQAPQQPSDDQSIRPTTSTPPQIQGRQQLEATPGILGHAEVDLSPEHEKFLIQQAAFKTNKNPHISAFGNRAQGELDQLRDTRKRQHEEKIRAHEESKSYDEEILKSVKRTKQQTEAVKDIRSALKSGKVTPGAVGNVFRNLGTVGEKVANAFKNAEQGKVEAAIPLLLEGWKEVFGVRLSDADLRLLETKLPDIGKSPEANNAVLDILEKYSKAPLLRGQVASEIKEKNGGYRPLNYADMVEKEVERQLTAQENVQVRGPDGNIYNVPRSRLQEALANQGVLIE